MYQNPEDVKIKPEEEEIYILPLNAIELGVMANGLERQLSKLKEDAPIWRRLYNKLNCLLLATALDDTTPEMKEQVNKELQEIGWNILRKDG